MATTIFCMLLAALITVQIIGMKWYRISESKMVCVQSGGSVLNAVRDEIRAGKILLVGSGNESSFAAVTNNNAHEGNALQIYSTTNLNGDYVRYYMDGTALKRISNGAVRTVANYITNTSPFSAEDFSGITLSNNQDNRVIRLSLDFYRWDFNGLSNNTPMAEYYHLQTRVAKRLIQ